MTNGHTHEDGHAHDDDHAQADAQAAAVARLSCYRHSRAGGNPGCPHRAAFTEAT